MRCWNAIALCGLPFLPCFAVGGELLQFCVVVRTAAGGVAVEDASAVFSMRSDLGRLRIVRASCNMFRVLVALRRQMPAVVPPLYTEQPRANGETITIMDDHVLNVCWPAEDGVYACIVGDSRIPCAVWQVGQLVGHSRIPCLMGHSRIPCAIRVTSKAVPTVGGMAHLKMAPVCAEVLPAA